MSGLAGAALSVLMVGHSLFGSPGPDLLATALAARAPESRVQAQIINGAPLKYNWDHAADAEGVNARTVLPSGEVSHLILTEAIPLANHIQWSDTERYAMEFAGLALAANPDAHVLVQETWHSLRSGTGAQVAHDAGAHQPWRARLTQDLGAWEGIVTSLRRNAPQAAGRIALIPAGQAMGLLADEIAAGSVPGLTEITQVFDDDIHPNTLGHYFVSMVQAAVITGADPRGLPFAVKDRWGGDLKGPSAAQAAAFQRIAWAAVQSYQGRTNASAAPVLSPEAPPRRAEIVPVDLVQTSAQGGTGGKAQIAVGLAPVTDWSVQQPFLDVMKTARRWIGHLPGQWGGVEYEALIAGGYLDAEGWLTGLPPETGSVGTLILTDMPPMALDLAGRYVLRFEGKGVIEVTGRATGVRYGKNEVRFDYVPGPGAVELRVQRLSSDDPVRRITVVREDHLAAFDQGALFNPDWLARLRPFATLRFMDWMATNNSTQTTWDARPRPDDATWAPDGVPLEVMLALANTLQADAWFNMPHLADDTYVREFAATVAKSLEPGRKVYVEYSNEVWNWQFDQTAWAGAEALALWGQDEKGMQYYGLRAAEIAGLWSTAFGDQADARLVNVISSQTGWLGLEAEVLDAPLAVAIGRTRPAEAFDAYAITGYFGGILGTEARADLMQSWLDASAEAAAAAADAAGLTGQARADHIDSHRFDLAAKRAGQELIDGRLSGDPLDTLADLSGRVWPYHAEVAARHGLQLIMYEGGTHVVGIGPQVDDERMTAFFQHFNYTPEMGALYTQLVQNWQDIGGDLFNAYADVYWPTKWGSWGMLRYLSDDNPRWNALMGAK